MRRLLPAILVALLASACSRAAARDDTATPAAIATVAATPTAGAGVDAPPAPIGLTLTMTAPGAYRLDVRPAAPVTPYVVRAHVSGIGTDQGVVTDLGKSDGAALSIGLPLPLDGMGGAGCYRVGFDIASAPEVKPGAGAGIAGLDTRACVGVNGLVVFPAFDGITEPPPAPPSDVRIVREPGIGEEPDTWRVEWRDNSDDEIAFHPRIMLLDRPWGEGGSALAAVNMPEVPAGQTSIGSIGFLFAPDGPPQRTCGYALVLVFAIGPDSASIWPGNATVPACFGAGEIWLAEAGVGKGGG